MAGRYHLHAAHAGARFACHARCPPGHPPAGRSCRCPLHRRSSRRGRAALPHHPLARVAGRGCQGSIGMLSRRLILAGPALAVLSRNAVAQPRRDNAGTDIVLLSADSGAAAVQAVNNVVARIRTPNVNLHGETAPDVLNSIARLADRPTAVGAMLPSVSLAYMTLSGLPEHVVHANRFIGRMGVSELHVLASQRVGSLRDLAGQKVAVGPKGSSTQATAAAWLDRTGFR